MSLTDVELAEVDAANKSGKTPVVFIHGLWLLSSSWQPWRELFEAEGYATIAPSWPDDPATVEESLKDPDTFAGKTVKQVTDHYAEAIDKLTGPPVLIGHSFGGLIAQILAGQGKADVTVGIDPAQFKGVTALPVEALKSGAPALLKFNHTKHGVTLTQEQFNYGWANAVSDDEAKHLYETFHVPGSGLPIFQAATANFTRMAETTVITDGTDRGPLLLISGAEDHTVPPAVVENEFKIQQKNSGDTEFVSIPGRGHSLIIDSGWRSVADAALEFVQRYLP